MTTLTISPLTGSTNIKKLNEFEKSITSESKFIDSKTSNFICLDTGIIYNANGPRFIQKQFYEEDYDLHNENDLSEFKYTTKIGYSGIYDNIVSLINKNLDLSKNGKVLDIGCGKGLFLKTFIQKNPTWKAFGIEPSKNACKFHRTTIPFADVSNTDYKSSNFLEKKFNLIVANGVLEHVLSPFEFLSDIKKSLKENGVCFIGVPNFKNNPIDMYTYDHLYRFTPETITFLFEKIGFKILDQDVSSTKVPMWFILKKSNRLNKISKPDIPKQLDIFNVNKASLELSFKNFKTCFDYPYNEKIAVYGTGSIFPIFSLLQGINLKYIDCFIDDNDTLIGTQKMGLMINSLDYLKNKLIKKIIISSNPCYHKQMIKKLKNLNISDLEIYN